MRVPFLGSYKFKAIGKPIIHFEINNETGIPQSSLPSGTCTDMQAEKESDQIEMFENQMIPITVWYKFILNSIFIQNKRFRMATVI